MEVAGGSDSVEANLGLIYMRWPISDQLDHTFCAKKLEGDSPTVRTCCESKAYSL